MKKEIKKLVRKYFDADQVRENLGEIEIRRFGWYQGWVNMLDSYNTGEAEPEDLIGDLIITDEAAYAPLIAFIREYYDIESERKLDP